MNILIIWISISSSKCIYNHNNIASYMNFLWVLYCYLHPVQIRIYPWIFGSIWTLMDKPLLRIEFHPTLLFLLLLYKPENYSEFQKYQKKKERIMFSQDSLWYNIVILFAKLFDTTKCYCKDNKRSKRQQKSTALRVQLSVSHKRLWVQVLIILGIQFQLLSF